MREGDDTKQGLSPAIIAGIVLLVVIAAAFGTYLTQMVSDNGPVDVVVLKSDIENFKEKPQEIIKEADAGTDSTVLIMLEELNASKEDVEIITLQPDAPEMPEVTLETPAQEAPEVADASQATEKDVDAADEAPKDDTAKDDAPKVDTSGENALDEKIVEETKPLKRPVRPLVIENPVASAPSMMVQLAAFRNQEKAEQVAALLTEKHKERLEGLTLGIMKADTGGSGIFWRVTTEPLPTQDARALCDALKRAGQDCIFRKVALQ